jgi:hypothetical protein
VEEKEVPGSLDDCFFGAEERRKILNGIAKIRYL